MGMTTPHLGRRNTEYKKEDTSKNITSFLLASCKSSSSILQELFLHHLLPAHLATKGKLLPEGRRPEPSRFSNSSSSLPCEEASNSSEPRQSMFSATTRKTSEEYDTISLTVIPKNSPPPWSLLRHPLDEDLRGGRGGSFM